MKKYTFLPFLLFFVIEVGLAQDSLFFRGAKYRVDTLVHKHDVGLGSMFTSFELPDLPLQVHVMEIDLTNPYVKVKSVLSNDTLRGLERPSEMAMNNSWPGHQVFAAVNGDFYITSGSDIGLPVNGHVSGGQVAKVPHAQRSVVAFDEDKVPFIDVMSFKGALYYKDQSMAFNNVNTARGADQLILYNHYNGLTTKTNNYGSEVVLELAEGQWQLNSRVLLRVKEVRQGQGATPLSSEELVVSGHGIAKTFLDQMLPGETLEIDPEMTLQSQDVLPQLTELIGGDRTILVNGTISENNWPELHPRTSVGFSSDKKKVFLMVVDGRSIKSIGVSTMQLAELMKLSGASDAINLDGGGSSAMVVRNQVANTSSDGTERRVANALLFLSEAPESPAIDFGLNARSVTVPFGSKFQLKGITYNTYGDVVDYLNAVDITYSVEGQIGDVDQDGLFSADGAGQGLIIAQWQDLKDTCRVKVLPINDLSLSISQLAIDHLNDYKFEVYGRDENGETYLVDNDMLVFESLDTSIGMVDEMGVFSGLGNGIVTVRVSTRDEVFEDFCEVSVEIGRGHALLDDFSDPSLWTVSISWVNNVNLTRETDELSGENLLKVAYSLSYANRTAFISLARSIPIYGMPDSLLLEASGNGYKASFILSIDHPAGISTVPVFTGTGVHTFQTPIRVADIPQVDYPLSFKSLRLTIERDAAYVGGQTYEGFFYLRALKAVYPEKDVSNSLPDRQVTVLYRVFPNPAQDGIYISGLSNEAAAQLLIYNLSGQQVFFSRLDFTTYPSPVYLSLKAIPKGIYLYEISGRSGHENGKLVIE